MLLTETCDTCNNTGIREVNIDGADVEVLCQECGIGLKKLEEACEYHFGRKSINREPEVKNLNVCVK